MPEMAVSTQEPRQVTLGAEPAPTFSRASLGHARDTHANLQGMVQLADQKAATLMGATGVIVALLGSNLIDRFKVDGSHRAALWLGGLTLLILLGAALCSILVLVPRFPRPDQVPVLAAAPRLLWGLDAYSVSPDAYLTRLLAVSAEGAVADFAFENVKITWILNRKWRWLGWAARTLVLAFVAWAAAVAAAVLGG